MAKKGNFGDREGEKPQTARDKPPASLSVLPLLPSAHLLIQPASDVHGEVGIPSERIAPLPKGVHLAYCPGGLLRR